MKKISKYVNTIDRKAFLVTVVGVAAFIWFVSTNDNAQMFLNLKSMMSKSHENSPSADVYCSKKGNNGTTFCSDRRAVVNEKWKEVVTSTGGSKQKTSFSMNR